MRDEDRHGEGMHDEGMHDEGRNRGEAEGRAAVDDTRAAPVDAGPGVGSDTGLQADMQDRDQHATDPGDARWREAFRQGAPAALWQAAVRDAGGRIGLHLDEDCESYLVFVLLRYQREPRFFDGAQALGWLHAQSLAATARAEALRDIGDRCLLLAGLYPGLAERRRVSADYFAQLGRSAYQGVAEASRTAYAALFAHLAQAYRDLVRLLSVLPADAKPKRSHPLQAGFAMPVAAVRLH